MAAKSTTYKIQAFVPEYPGMKFGRNNRKRTYSPVIEHNIPEDYIVTQDPMELNHISTHTEEGWYFSPKYFNISEEQYNRIAHKIIWPTEIYTETGYLGAIIFRVKYDEKNWDILCWLNEKTYNDKKYINLYPCNYIKHDVGYNSYYEMHELPNRAVKIFFTKEEWKADKIKKSHESKKKLKESWEKRYEVTASAPTFSFTTPKFKIINIVQKTDWVKDAKVGDIIHGETPIISTDKNGKAVGCLHGGMSYSNYVDVYLNEKKVRSISPITFQELFLNNYKVEEVK